MHRPPVPFFPVAPKEAQQENCIVRYFYFFPVFRNFDTCVTTPITSSPPQGQLRLTTTAAVSPTRWFARNKQKQAFKNTSSLIMYLSKSEKTFLVSFTFMSLISLLCTSGAIFIDKHAIIGTEELPSTCMLSDTHDCRTAFRSNAVRQIVAVCVRVDIFFSCIAFVTGVILISFKIFNFRLLIAFLATDMFKGFFIFVATTLIIINSDYYFDALETAVSGFCGDDFCLDEDRWNVVIAFTLLLASGLSVICIAFIIFALGSNIIKKYEDFYCDATWATMSNELPLC